MSEHSRVCHHGSWESSSFFLLEDKVCWYILSISLIFSQVASQWLVVQLKEWNKKKNYSKVAAVMLLSLVVFISGLYLIDYAWKRSVTTQKLASPQTSVGVRSFVTHSFLPHGEMNA